MKLSDEDLVIKKECHNFKCEICDKALSSKQFLKKHLQAHAGEKLYKPHACDTCGKTFPTISQLKRHTIPRTNQ